MRDVLSKKIVAFALSVSVVVVLLVLHTMGITETGLRMGFQTLSRNIVVDPTGAGYFVIQDSESWDQLFDSRRPVFLQEVDFSRDTVIAVFMGMFPTAGYSIDVSEIINTGLTIVVKVTKKYPDEGCLVGQVITNPAHIVKTDKILKPILFRTSTCTIDCS